jgi:hypothetical protein
VGKSFKTQSRPGRPLETRLIVGHVLVVIHLQIRARVVGCVSLARKSRPAIFSPPGISDRFRDDKGSLYIPASYRVLGTTHANAGLRRPID